MDYHPNIENIPPGTDVFFIPKHHGRYVLLSGKNPCCCIAGSEMVSALASLVANSESIIAALKKSTHLFASLPVDHDLMRVYPEVMNIVRVIDKCADVQKMNTPARKKTPLNFVTAQANNHGVGFGRFVYP